MLKHKIYLGALCVALSGASLSQAAFAAVDDEAGFTVGVDYGRTEAKKYCDHITNCSSSDNGPRVEIGYEFNKTFAVELGYTSFGTIFDASEDSLSIQQKSNAVTLSALGSVPIGDWFGVFGRVGYARYDTNNTGAIEGVPIDDESGNTPFWGAGVKFTVTPEFAIRVEYQNYRDLSDQPGHKDDVQGLFAGGVYRF